MLDVKAVLSRLERVRRSGDRWTARCPAHDDSDPSLSIEEGRNGRVLLHCFAGCDPEDIARALGLNLADLGPEDGTGPGYTLADYAEAKNLPAAELQRWGIEAVEREKGSVVAIPYRTASGEPDGVKIRAGDRFWWDEHSKLPYGLDILEDADEGRSVLLVEGESDAHVCWHHGMLALGVPGANSWRSEWTGLLQSREVYVWKEPDEGGEQFVRAVTTDLPDALVIEAPEDANDPAELHQQDPDAFGRRMRGLVDGAVPADKVEGFLDNLDLDWGEPVPLGPASPDPYPLESLPGWVGRHVASVARSTQVPTDLPFLLGLSALSTAAANKVRLRIRPGHREPTHLFTATVLGPGNRKSPAYRHMIRLILDYEDEEAKRIAPDRRRAEDERKVLKKALEKARREAAKAAGSEEAGEARQRMAEMREELEELDAPTVPRLVASDVTSEKLARLMADNHGRIAVLAPEGDLFRIMAGRYSGGVNFDHYKRAWSGDEPIRDDRMGREGTHVQRPALTLGLTLQPSVLETLEEKRSFRGEGLLGRLLYGVPDSWIGARKTGADVPHLDRDTAERYDALLRRLLEMEPKAVEDGQYVPHDIPLSPEAREIFFAFEAEVEEELGPGGRLEHIRDWGAKLTGHTARVAALLHLARRVGDGLDPVGAEVSGTVMEAAVEVGRAAIAHALRVFDVLEQDPEVRLARYLLRRIESLTEEGQPPSQSELLQAVKQKRGLETADNLNQVLDRLEGHNLVRCVPPPSDGPGRPPSPRVILRPDTTSKVQEIQGTPSIREVDPQSLDFLDEKCGEDAVGEEVRI